jgi:magnesium-transporting ATPase (P-type)
MNKKFELEKQLHEQYAINNNANVTSIVALITTRLGVVGVYGYVFVHSTIEFANDFGKFVCTDEKYSLDVLLFSAMASYLILVIIFYLSAYLGTNQRKEQFITFAIRRKHYERGEKKDYDKIFPLEYHPFDKSKSKFIQGLYGEICSILKILFWIITILTFVKLGCNFGKFHEGQVLNSSGFAALILFIIFVTLSLVSFCCILEKFYFSYQEREKEFSKNKFGAKYIKGQVIKRPKKIICICKFFWWK